MVSNVNSTYDSVSAGNDSILPDGQAHQIMAPMGFKVRQIVFRGGEIAVTGRRFVARGSEENWDGMLKNAKNRGKMAGRKGKRRGESSRVKRSRLVVLVYTSQYLVAGLLPASRGDSHWPEILVYDEIKVIS